MAQLLRKSVEEAARGRFERAPRGEKDNPMKLQHRARAHLGAVGAALLALTTSLNISAHDGDDYDPKETHDDKSYEPNEILAEPCDWWADVAAGNLDVLEVVNGEGEQLRVLMAGGNLGVGQPSSGDDDVIQSLALANTGTVMDRVTFNVELLRGDECSGDKFFLSLGSKSTAFFPAPTSPFREEISVDVHNWDGSLVGGLFAEEGGVPKIHDQFGNDIPSGDLGPLVLTRDFGNPLFTLLDAQVLAYLGPPRTVNGYVPTSNADQELLNARYDDFVTEHERLYSLLLFRADLSGINSSWRANMADGIRERAWGPPIYHDDGRYHDDHHHVDHFSTRGPHDNAHPDFPWGGWLDGHRRYLTVLTRGVEAQLPFGRLPTWDTRFRIPTEFDLWITSDTAPNVPTDLTPAELCDSYAPERDGFGRVSRHTLEDSETAFFNMLNGWHGAVHLAVGGRMSVPVIVLPLPPALLVGFSTGAQTPIFWAWHSGLDQIWRTWQLCWPSWHAERYTWDQDETLDFALEN